MLATHFESRSNQYLANAEWRTYRDRSRMPIVEVPSDVAVLGFFHEPGKETVKCFRKNTK